MGIYIKGLPSEGVYRLTYQRTTDKGTVAVLEDDEIAFIGQIVKEPHGRLIDADELLKKHFTKWTCYDAERIGTAPTVIEAEGSE